MASMAPALAGRAVGGAAEGWQGTRCIWAPVPAATLCARERETLPETKTM